MSRVRTEDLKARVVRGQRIDVDSVPILIAMMPTHLVGLRVLLSGLLLDELTDDVAEVSSWCRRHLFSVFWAEESGTTLAVIDSNHPAGHDLSIAHMSWVVLGGFEVDATGVAGAGGWDFVRDFARSRRRLRVGRLPILEIIARINLKALYI